MVNLKTKKNLYKSPNGVTRVDEVIYNGESLYCIKHCTTNTALLFDHDEKLCNLTIKKIKRTEKGIIVRPKVNNGYEFQFRGSKRERSVTIPLYLYAYYNGIPLTNKLRRSKIVTLDNNGESSGIYDFRKDNLYKMASQQKDIDIIERPLHPEEKYITITKYGRTEVQDFSEELYELLTNDKVSLGYDKRCKRQYASVQYGKGRDDRTSYHVAKLVLMFYTHFGRYSRMSGAITRFIKAIPKISKELEECAHVDANSWNNLSTNIMSMSSKTNKAMRDFIKDFVDEYDAHPIILPQEQNVILLELKHNGRLYYFRCDTAEDYCDLQKQFLGKTSVLNDTTARKNGREILTPKQVRDRIGRKKNEDFDVMLEIWRYCDRRDYLQSLYNKAPRLFFHWKKTEGGGVSNEQALCIACVVAGLPVTNRAFVRMIPISSNET